MSTICKHLAGSRVRRSAICWLSAVGLASALAAPGADSPIKPLRSARDWNDHASALAREEKWEPAIEAFTEAIKLAPERSELLVNRAVAYERQKRWDRAEADCTTAIGVNAEDSRAYLQRAIVRTELGRHEEAFADASRAARMEPDNAQCVFIRYLLCSRTGRLHLGHTAGETYIGLRGWGDAWSPYVALLNHVMLRRAGDAKAAEHMLAEAENFGGSDQWPAPIIQFLHGKLATPELLGGATARDRATLARYYVGVERWLAGDATAARAHFEWITTNGDPSFLQHRLAGDHLQELPATGSGTASKKQPGQ